MARIQLADALGHEVSDKRIEILRRIGDAGSISEAARASGVSYKAAWQAIETLSNLAGTALVEKVVGGSGGGGAALTAAGKRVLRAADLMGKARATVLAQFERDAGTAVQGITALALQTSMRNQLPCKVARLESDGASVHVVLEVTDNTLINAHITQESVQLLGLKTGQSVLALCKATAVRVAKRIAPAKGNNLLHGVVRRASGAKGGGEISLELSNGLQLTGFGKAGHGLKKGARAMAAVPESGVVIAVSA